MSVNEHVAVQILIGSEDHKFENVKKIWQCGVGDKWAYSVAHSSSLRIYLQQLA